MIRAYIGLLGSGKTLSMVNDASDLLKTGRRVFTNVPFRLLDSQNTPTFLNGKQFEYALKTETNALFLIDEASIVLPSYYWNKLSSDYIIRFAQARKYGLDIFYTSQGWNHTVRRLRDLTNEVVKCSKYTIAKWDFIKNTTFDPEYFDQKVISGTDFEKKFIIANKTLFPKTLKRLYKMYDTYHLITTSTTMGVGLEEIPDKPVIDSTDYELFKI